MVHVNTFTLGNVVKTFYSHLETNFQILVVYIFGHCVIDGDLWYSTLNQGLFSCFFFVCFFEWDSNLRRPSAYYFTEGKKAACVRTFTSFFVCRSSVSLYLISAAGLDGLNLQAMFFNQSVVIPGRQITAAGRREPNLLTAANQRAE